MERIAFIVLTWNSSEFISRCVASILQIESFDVELLIVDNGSTDETKDIVRAFSDSRVVLLPQNRNLGTTQSRNIALAQIGDAEYVCVLDSDTEVNEGAIRTMVKCLQEDSSIGVVGPTMVNSLGTVQLSGRNLPTLSIKLAKAFPVAAVQKKGYNREVPATLIEGGLQEVPYLLSACWVLPRKTIESVGMFDEKIFYAPEDVDYCVRIWKAGYRCVLCHNARIVHEYQRISKKKIVSKMNWEHVKGLAYYFRKYGYLFDSSKAVRMKK